ncbi:MAG TPA: hypothetical protein VJ874_00875 [Candidatus Thermoplasmatota archaeon]|nr:hypothetical protein [Candidatus Thermoplasmatota archaeon]
MGRERSARPWLPVRRFGGDDEGSFMVLEAILVALLVLTAVLFFTSVQRPSTGPDQGGLDLAQVSADTLAILRVRTFNGDSFDAWMTKLALGDSATNCVAAAPTATTCPTALEIQEFLEEVLPTGARYSLRIDNGVDSLPLLPIGAAPEPHGGRASQVLFVPSWGTYASQSAVPGTGPDSAAPDEALTPPTHATLSRFTDPDEVKCIKAPNAGSGTLGSVGPGGATWVSWWQRTAASMGGSADAGEATVPSTTGLEVGMHVQGAGVPPSATISAITDATTFTISGDPSFASTSLTFVHNRVPAGAFHGTWAGYSDPACAADEAFAKVWSPRFRAVSGVSLAASMTDALTCPALPDPPCFSSLDVYLPVIGPNIPSGARIASIDDTNRIATLDVAPTSTGSTTLQLPSYSPYVPYSLELVVWFGA